MPNPVIADINILLLFAHPSPDRSRVNRALIERISGVPGLVINDLYEHYPDFHIDIKREQGLLEGADLIIFQHPFYWYSAPALLKEWQDRVLEYGFAYGPGGEALRGKRLLSVISTGHDAEAYREGGGDHYPMATYLRPYEQIARLCHMEYLPPRVIHGSRRLSDQQLDQQAEAYRRQLLDFAPAVARGVVQEVVDE